MSDQRSIDLASCGWLSRKLIAALTGLPARRLAAWHRAGILPATLVPGGRGVNAVYTWDDYRKIQLAERLLSNGLHPRRLRVVMEEFCSVIEPGKYTNLTVLNQRPVIQTADGPARTAEREPQGVNWPVLDQAALDTDLLTSRLAQYVPANVDIRSVLAAWMSGARLGQLSEFSEYVDINPRVHGGSPIVRGTRLETAFISSVKSAGMSLAEIAEEYDLRLAQVRQAIRFEARLQGDVSPIAA